ncbi:MAG: hypothetical protein HFI86_06790 [Bacilli bacterium]|nr:hypothetical protein [Bacilli bacterium]
MNMIDDLFFAKKIAIFGWPATGKSTFGNFISNKLNIELFSLDLIRWKYSKEGIKNDDKFLNEYEKILKKDKWIIEGNALDWIDSRLKKSDILIFFDSTVDTCIENYKIRWKKVISGKEKWLNFDKSKKPKESIEWIKNRYSKKIEKLRPILNNYRDKLIIINNYEELNDIITKINLK